MEYEISGNSRLSGHPIGREFFQSISNISSLTIVGQIIPSPQFRDLVNLKYLVLITRRYQSLIPFIPPNVIDLKLVPSGALESPIDFSSAAFKGLQILELCYIRVDYKTLSTFPELHTITLSFEHNQRGNMLPLLSNQSIRKVYFNPANEEAFDYALPFLLRIPKLEYLRVRLPRRQEASMREDFDEPLGRQYAEPIEREYAIFTPSNLQQAIQDHQLPEIIEDLHVEPEPEIIERSNFIPAIMTVGVAGLILALGPIVINYLMS